MAPIVVRPGMRLSVIVIDANPDLAPSLAAGGMNAIVTTLDPRSIPRDLLDTMVEAMIYG